MSWLWVGFALLLRLSAADWEDDIVDGSLDSFFNLAEINALIDAAATDHSTATKDTLYATTAYISLRDSGSPINSGTVVVSAAQFAGFPYGPQLAAYLIEKMTEEAEDETVKKLLTMGRVIVVPVVNTAAITEKPITERL